jgi:hypothetical protein
MKKIYLLLAYISLSASTLFAQEVIRATPCNSADIQKQADSLKALYEKDGFTLMRENSIAMESGYEMPVVMQLQQGSWYQFVFIGEMTSKLYEVRMFDWNEKQVIYQKKMWGDIDGNIIAFSYIPQFTEYHMLRPVQENKKKKKELCGYVMMFQKTKK